MLSLENILIRPLLTEKLSKMTEDNNFYGFQVAAKSNKHQIKMAIEKLFDVKVLEIKTTTLPGKSKRHRNGVKKLSNFKKAYVKVKEGQKIEFFRGI